MRRFIMAAFIAASTLILPAHAGVLENWISHLWKSDKPEAPSIKVLVEQEKKGVVLEVKGKYRLLDPHTMEHISTRFTGKRRFAQPMSNGIKWGEEFPGIYQILIVPEDNKSSVVVDGIEYKGSIYLYDVDSKLSAVNQVFIEDYITSIVGSRLQTRLSDEFLSALVIAERTRAYDQAIHPKTEFWTVDAQKVNYEGIQPIRNAAQLSRIISTTRYMVLTTKDGLPFDADWTKSKISLSDAENMAKAGDTATQILAKAFPGSSVKVLLTLPD
jgi:stage II sporulation protein D